MEKLLTLRTTVAFCNEMIDVYLAKDLVRGEQHLDEAESISLRVHSLEELLAMILEGKITGWKNGTAILAYQVLLMKNEPGKF